MTWDRPAIKAAVQRLGGTLKGISLAAGLPPDAASKALSRPYPAAERAIADYLAVGPSELWPDRYEDGMPVRKRKGFPLRRPDDWARPGPKRSDQ